MWMRLKSDSTNMKICWTFYWFKWPIESTTNYSMIERVIVRVNNWIRSSCCCCCCFFQLLSNRFEMVWKRNQQWFDRNHDLIIHKIDSIQCVSIVSSSRGANTVKVKSVAFVNKQLILMIMKWCDSRMWNGIKVENKWDIITNQEPPPMLRIFRIQSEIGKIRMVFISVRKTENNNGRHWTRRR